MTQSLLTYVFYLQRINRQCQASKKINEAILFFSLHKHLDAFKYKKLAHFIIFNVSADEMNVINHLTYVSHENCYFVFRWLGTCNKQTQV